MKSSYKKSLGLLAIGAAIFAGSSHLAAADTIGLSYTESAAGTTGSGTVTTLQTPGSFYYGDTFEAPTTTIPGSDYGFYDDFLFTVTASSADLVTSTINSASALGFSDIQVRIYNANGQTTLPTLGTPTGTVINGTTSTITYAPGVTGFIDTITGADLAPGTYVLEVYGDVSGTSGGSYSGSLNLEPVPIPNSLILMLSGLALLFGGVKLAKKAAFSHLRAPSNGPIATA